jgi:hypothetical protein
VETGAEYFLPSEIALRALRIWAKCKRYGKERIHTELWLTDFDVLQVAFNSVAYFNIFMLLRVFLQFLIMKWRNLWRKERKKSTI